jgi:hypothetical protein
MTFSAFFVGLERCERGGRGKKEEEGERRWGRVERRREEGRRRREEREGSPSLPLSLPPSLPLSLPPWREGGFSNLLGSSLHLFSFVEPGWCE